MAGEGFYASSPGFPAATTTVIPDFTENISLVLHYHYNQTILDINIDQKEIREVLTESMPNVFVMALASKINFET